jgi:dihydrolipoamide dehydrogenase
VLVEGQALGGTCLNIGCIPSKALIHVAEQFHQTQHHNQHSALGISVAAPTLDIGKSVEWKDGIVDRLTTGVAALLKKNKVQVIHGWAKVIDGKTVEVGDTRIQCEHLVLATGSKSVNLPMLPIGGPIISSTEALAPKALPNTWWWSAAVTSAWSWASPTASSAPRSAWSRRGAHPAGLRRRADPAGARRAEEAGREAAPEAQRQGFATCLQVRDPQRRHPAWKPIRCWWPSVASRTPRAGTWKRWTWTMNGAAIKIDDRCQTSMRNVWAIGDLSGEPMLAHRAMAQGEMVAELISGKPANSTRRHRRRVLHRPGSGGGRPDPGRGQGCRAGLHRFAASRSPPMAGP